MSQADLNRLERDVIQARARFAGDLAVLRSPKTFDDFKDDVRAKATEVKDGWVEQAKASATDTVDGMVADLKGKANANPAAVLAIGAGLAWRLSRHPPIASLLVGLGLWSLWRTTPDPEGEGFGPRTMELANATKDKVQDWSAQAGEAVTHLADQAAATADQVTASVREKVHDMQDAAMAAAGSVRATVHDVQDAAMAAAGRATSTTRDTASYLQREAGSAGEKASALLRQAGSAGEKASALLRDHTPDEIPRDSLLLGAAALAVTAAVGIAYQRRS